MRASTAPASAASTPRTRGEPPCTSSACTSSASTEASLASSAVQQQKDVRISTMKWEMAEMKTSMDTFTMRQNSMSQRLYEQEMLFRQMSSVFANRYDRVALAAAEVICYADGMRDKVNEIWHRMEIIESALYELSEDIPSEETDAHQEPPEPREYHDDTVISIVTPAKSELSTEDELESALTSSPLGLVEAVLTQKVLEFDSRHQYEIDSVTLIMVEVFRQFTTPAAYTDSKSSDLNSDGPNLSLAKEETTADQVPDKDQDGGQAHQKHRIRRSLSSISSWLDSGRRALRR